jgi:hypothetical protein
MSDFRIKILGLTGFAMAFAGMSYGQVTCQNAAAQLIQPTANIGFLLRAESEAENVSETVLPNCVSTATAGVTVEVTLSLPVTSKAVASPFTGVLTASAAGGSGNSEATLLINDNTAHPGNNNPNVAGALATYNAYSGTVAGNLISFTNVSFPANYTAVFVDIRVNASLAGALAAVVPVTETIILGQNGIAEYTASATVGQVLRGLAAPTLVGAAGQQVFLSNGVASPVIAVCTGDAIGSKVPTAEFTITVNEGFPGAFKLQADPSVPPNATNQEQGVFVNPANGVGVASSATQITLTFGNVPSTAIIYVPTSVSVGDPAATLTLLNSQVAATTPSGLTLIPAASGIYTNGPVAALPAAVGGIVTAVYTVTATSQATQENFQIPVYLNLAATTAAAPLLPQAAITVLESLAPSGALPASGLANSIPIFATTTNTPISLQSVVLCQTTLLFPYVTNAAGFETGIAIANTTTDNLIGLTATTEGVSFAAPTNGTCILNFYGGQAVLGPFSTSTIGAYAAGPPVIAPVYANTLSSISGAAAGFTGYAIAACNFLDAHGFAFILDGSGTGTASGPEGYLAVVIPRGSTLGGGADGGSGN